MKPGKILIAVAGGVVGAPGLAPGQFPEAGSSIAAPLSAAIPWIAILISLVAAAAICVVGFKSSHRTHLD